MFSTRSRAAASVVALSLVLGTSAEAKKPPKDPPPEPPVCYHLMWLPFLDSQLPPEQETNTAHGAVLLESGEVAVVGRSTGADRNFGRDCWSAYLYTPTGGIVDLNKVSPIDPNLTPDPTDVWLLHIGLDINV